MSNIKEILKQAEEYSLQYASQISSRTPYPSEYSLNDLSRFDEPLPNNPADPLIILKLLHDTGSPATAVLTGGRYFGFVNGGILPAALGASWLADVWNQNAALHVMSPVASKLESICERWIAELLGLDPSTAMGLVTGSSNATLCALAAARNYLLQNAGHDIYQKGLTNAPHLRILTGKHAHASVITALSILGFGKQDIEWLGTDSCGRIVPELIPEMDSRTLCIIQAGNVNGGAFDPIYEICSRAKASGAWVHIDGAFGLWAAASRQHRHLVRGIELADSWSLDAHKTLNAGYDCGILLCRHRQSLVQALMTSGNYIAYGSQRDGMAYTTEMSRRARAIPLWAALKSLGKYGVEELVDRMCSLAYYFADLLRKGKIHIISPVCFNQFMISGKDDDETQNFLNAINQSKVCWCSGSRFNGRFVIRISVSSHATTREDIELSAASIIKAYKAIADTNQ